MSLLFIELQSHRYAVALFSYIMGVRRKIMANKRLEKLRLLMKKKGIDAYLVLTDDFHGSEYVGDYFKCREYISGFTGSAGTLVVLADEAGLWTDGRYFIQAEKQLAGSGIALFKEGEPGVPTISAFLKEKLSKGQKIGFDGRTVSMFFGVMLKRNLPGIDFVTDADLAGEIWKKRPAMSEKPVWLLGDEYTGMSRLGKLMAVRMAMGTDHCLISSLDDIAWIMNFRGDDIAYNPVALSYLLISKENAVLYISPAAVPSEVKAALEEDGVVLKPYMDVYEDIKGVRGSILVDGKKCNMTLVSSIDKSVKVVSKDVPSKLMKAKKNAVEAENERQAHIKDGVAVTKFIYWLKNQEPGTVTEISAADKLEEFRKQGEGYLGQSFEPIIAYGEHGAIVHYAATSETDVAIGNESFVLMDTGGHYLQGTTDITRTVATGNITEDQKEKYTAVLAGNLNLSAAYFKKGTNGNNLDYLARNPLWKLGMDYNHGTGHGVGYLLNVHEGPQGIRMKNGDTPFAEGMLTSNEPGVYIEGEYGIRLENLILCIAAEEGFLKFDTLTLVPFERKAILPEKLTEEQKQTLNDYHRQVYEKISPYLDENEREWLRQETCAM